MFILGSSTKGTLELINPYKFKNPYITSITPFPAKLCHVQQCGYDQYGNEHQWRGVNDPSWFLFDRWNHYHSQHHDRYFILHIHQGFGLRVHLDPVLPHHRFHQFAWHLRNPRIRRVCGILPVLLYGSNVIEIVGNCQVIQVYSTIVRSSDLKNANQNNNLLTTIIIDDSTTNSCRSVVDICIPMIPDSIDWCCVQGLERLNIASFVRVMQIVIISQESRSAGSVTSLDYKQLSKPWSAGISRTDGRSWSIQVVERRNTSAIHKPTSDSKCQHWSSCTLTSNQSLATRTDTSRLCCPV